MPNEKGISLDSFANGAIREQFERAVAAVVVNMNDPNTSAKVKREINIKIVFTPDENRETSAYTFTVTPKLSAAAGGSGRIIFGVNAKGEPEYGEFKSEIPGQLDLTEYEPRVTDIRTARQIKGGFTNNEWIERSFGVCCWAVSAENNQR